MAVRRRGKKWVADYRDASGVRRWVTCATRAEAEEAEAKGLLDSRQAIQPAVDAKITVGAYAERWLSLIGPSLMPRSLDGYREKLDNHLLPALRDVRLRQLHRGRIKKLLVDKLASGLSGNTVRLIHATLRALLNAAVDDGVILANPAQGLGRTLRLGRSAAARQEEIKAFDRGQLARFLGATAKIWAPFYPLFMTMARTGVRIGEALALQWDDMDFAQREIRVARAIASTGQVDTPKSGHGRTVDMSAAVKDVLERLKTARQEKALGDATEVPAWVFATAAGTPFDHGRVGKVFKRVLKAAKLPAHYSPHSLRHTFASLLLQQGESPAYVQRQLGHASIKLTVDTYGRWLPMGNKAAVDRLDEGFVTPDEAVGSRLVATATPHRGRRPQVVEEMVRPARFERATYRFVVCRSIHLS